MTTRQPIVSVLGHVDHGKTTILDYIRGTTVVKREAGAITQHIGATEVPIETIYEKCGSLTAGKKFTVPGLLFIDTPGHHSFTTLRSRGGSLADLAILVVDVTEGFKPQTHESVNILKRYRTPFVVAANKVDRIRGWRAHKNECFMTSIAGQEERMVQELDNLIYNLAGDLYKHGFSAERYDRVEDFQKNVAIVPISAKHGEGIPDLLLMLVGLAQRFLEQQLKSEEGPAQGTVLEVKEEKGIGTTLDTIIYDGTIRKGDTIVVGTNDQPLVTRVKALLKPKPLDEIRDPRERFSSVDSVSAAAGVKIAGQDLEGAVAGAPLRVANENTDDIAREIMEETQFEIELDEEGVIIKADAIGSLEAMAYELKNAKVPIKKASIGDVSRRDIIDAATINEPLLRVIMAFNVSVLPDAREELDESNAKLFESDIVYRLLEEYGEWKDGKSRDLDSERREEVVHPGKFKILPECIFRQSKPAVCGVRVLAGRIRSGQGILREDGRVVGSIKSIQVEGKSVKEALAGAEVAISIDGVTMGRQLSGDDICYVDMPARDAKVLNEEVKLNYDEQEVLQQVFTIKRKQDKFWGM